MDIADMTLIGSGAQADVYLFENKAYKIFKPEYLQANAYNEAYIQNKVYKTGLPVPAIYEVTEINGRTAIAMEYINGKAFGEIMFQDMDNVYYYLDIAANLHIKMHSIDANDFPYQKDKLKYNILATPCLEEEKRKELLLLLQNLESDDKLCHGDFHILNMMQTRQDIKIIDWVDASNGSILADVCRSYLLYSLYRSEIAETYLQIYCNKANISEKNVLAWLPIIAGARLNENVNSQDVAILLNMVNGSLAAAD